jgi:hypothetical protein
VDRVRALIAMSERLAVVPDMTLVQAQQIVQAFGKTVAELAGMIADENRLPFPKPVIKQATLMVLPFAPSDEVRRGLKNCYLFLADFQPGLGDQVIRALPAGEKPPSTIEEIAAVAAHVEKWLPWSKRATAETQELLLELRDAGFRD